MITASKDNFEIDLRSEMKSLKVPGAKRTLRLENLYRALMTIKPTSTSSERVFSVAGGTITKIRSRMSPELLNALVFLKYYFLKTSR
jgi:hypothetical protein